jgi:hypothetical protein
MITRAGIGIGEIDESKLDLMSSADCARGQLQRICLKLLREHRERGDDGLPPIIDFSPTN